MKHCMSLIVFVGSIQLYAKPTRLDFLKRYVTYQQSASQRILGRVLSPRDQLRKMISVTSARAENKVILDAVQEPLEVAVELFKDTPGFGVTLSRFLSALPNVGSAKGYWYEMMYAVQMAQYNEGAWEVARRRTRSRARREEVEKEVVLGFSPVVTNPLRGSEQCEFDLITNQRLLELKTARLEFQMPDQSFGQKLIKQVKEQKKVVAGLQGLCDEEIGHEVIFEQPVPQVWQEVAQRENFVLSHQPNVYQLPGV